jgi:uncharacterized protein (TIGR01777 family)
MKVLITGASGFIGTALAAELESAGHGVVPLRRGGGPLEWDPARGWIDPAALEGVDAVVHLAGESVGGRWTASKKDRILRSRVSSTSLIAGAVAAARPRVLVSGSAIGFYGDRGNETLDEQAAPGSGFLADVVKQWEGAAQPAVTAGVRTVFARTSLVLDRSGGSFPRMLLPFRFGVGGRIGKGDQWWAWITLRDEVRALVHCITDTTLEGPVNLCSPNPAPNREFVRALAASLHRPALVPVPALALKAVLGGEFASEVLLASQRVVPGRLGDTGFSWEHPGLEAAFASMFA